MLAENPIPIQLEKLILSDPTTLFNSRKPTSRGTILIVMKTYTESVLRFAYITGKTGKRFRVNRRKNAKRTLGEPLCFSFHTRLMKQIKPLCVSR